MEVVQQKLAVLRTKLDKYPALQEAEVSLSVKERNHPIVVDETKTCERVQCERFTSYLRRDARLLLGSNESSCWSEDLYCLIAYTHTLFYLSLSTITTTLLL
jgi:hypothetical protein